MTHNEFLSSANIVDHESSVNDNTEMLYIAHTANNIAKKKGRTLNKQLKSSWSSVSESNKKPNKNANIGAKAAVISVGLGESDPTGGAVYFDGTDFLAWGLKSPNGTPHNKFEEYKSIHISEDIFTDYWINNCEKYGEKVRYSGKKYNLPATVFTTPQNWTISLTVVNWSTINERVTNTEKYFLYQTKKKNGKALKATKSAGLSIFWKIE